MSYGDPEVDALIPEARQVFVENYLDGDDGGRISSPAKDMADDVAEIMAVWAVRLLRAKDEQVEELVDAAARVYEWFRDGEPQDPAREDLDALEAALLPFEGDSRSEAQNDQANGGPGR